MVISKLISYITALGSCAAVSLPVMCFHKFHHIVVWMNYYFYNKFYDIYVYWQREAVYVNCLTLTLTTLTFKIVTYSITLEINLGYFKKYNINWHKWIILYFFLKCHRCRNWKEQNLSFRIFVMTLIGKYFSIWKTSSWNIYYSFLTVYDVKFTRSILG